MLRMTVLRANILSVSSLEQLKKDLETYKDGLTDKLSVFLDELLKIGIETAERHVDTSGTYGSHQMARLGGISFRKEVDTADGKVYGIMYGSGGDVTGEWYVNDGNGHYSLKTDTINSMLAVEFGTAGKALPVQDAFGGHGGQGTMSNHGHANDNAWYIITHLDSKGKPDQWKAATAITPSRPMYKAGLAMYVEVKKAALIAFRG